MLGGVRDTESSLTSSQAAQDRAPAPQGGEEGFTTTILSLCGQCSTSLLLGWLLGPHSADCLRLHTEVGQILAWALIANA